MIAHNPLHRSGRAVLPHPAPTLGDDAEAHEGIRMTNTSRGEPVCGKTLHPSPRQMVALTATAQRRPPQATNRPTKGTQRRTIQRHSVVAEVTEQDRPQISSLFRNGLVQASPQFFTQVPQLGLPSLAHRLSQHREVSLPGFPTTVREAQKVKRSRFAIATAASVVLRIAAELDDARFVGVQFQPELRKSLAQFCQKPLCFRTVFKARNEV